MSLLWRFGGISSQNHYTTRSQNSITSMERRLTKSPKAYNRRLAGTHKYDRICFLKYLHKVP